MNSLCVLPFVQFDNELGGECRPCCVNTGTFASSRTQSIRHAWNSEGWRELRRAFAAGERPASCRYCWDQEALHLESYRIQNNRWNGPLLDLRPEVFDARTGQMSAPPRKLVLKPSNACNLACRMCSPGVSTSVGRIWDSELEALSGQERKGLARNFPDEPALLGEIRELGPMLQQVSFGGGEPLCDPTLRNVLLALRPWASRVQTHANTNLTRLQHGDLDILALMTSFRSCILTISVDGPPALHAYIRPGFEIDDFLGNLERVRAIPRLELDCNIAVQILNVLRLPETLDFILRVVRPSSILMSLATGTGSEHLDVRTLPDELKAIASRRLLGFVQTVHRIQYPNVPLPVLTQAKALAEQVHRFMTSSELWSPAQWARLSAFYRKLDRTHDTSLSTVAPELASVLATPGSERTSTWDSARTRDVSAPPSASIQAGQTRQLTDGRDGPSRPLLHIPAHVPFSTLPAERDGTRRYVLELLLASLHSLHEHERRHDLLVTTNDPEILEVATRLRARAAASWELRGVTAQDIVTTFGVEPSRLTNEVCAKFLFSKFFPVYRRAAPWIVHLDMDTMVTSSLDFEPHGGTPISLVDANRVASWPPWTPSAAYVDFFGIAPGSTSRWSWINSGVFSARGAGLDACRAGLDHYLAQFDRATEVGIAADGDEALFNALALREREAVAVHPDVNDNLLAYHLPSVHAWRRSARIIHFHSLKPNVFRYAPGGRLTFECAPAMASRVTPDFCLAALAWCRNLHAAAGPLGLRLPTMQQMPAELVERDIERFTALLDRRENENVG